MNTVPAGRQAWELPVLVDLLGIRCEVLQSTIFLPKTGGLLVTSLTAPLVTKQEVVDFIFVGHRLCDRLRGTTILTPIVIRESVLRLALWHEL